MLTYDDLERAAALMQAYGEARPSYLETDAARLSGPTASRSSPAGNVSDSDPGVPMSVEVARDPKTGAWRLTRS